MGLKYQGLQRLVNRGFNVHPFEQIKTFTELQDYIQRNPLASFRFDRYHNIDSLPFYLTTDAVDWEAVMREANSSDCTILAANAVKHDAAQSCNFVMRVMPGGDVTGELSTVRGPLRRMYWHPGRLVAFGKPNETHYWYSHLVKRILAEFARNPIYNATIEGTLYPYPVGVFQRDVVYWQVIGRKL